MIHTCDCTYHEQNGENDHIWVPYSLQEKMSLPINIGIVPILQCPFLLIFKRKQKD